MVKCLASSSDLTKTRACSYRPFTIEPKITDMDVNKANTPSSLGEYSLVIIGDTIKGIN
jgi:hypothetical protein